MDNPKESWCSAASRVQEGGSLSGQLPIETLIAMRNETTEPLRKVGFFSPPHSKSISQAFADLLVKRQIFFLAPFFPKSAH